MFKPRGHNVKKSRACKARTETRWVDALPPNFLMRCGRDFFRTKTSVPLPYRVIWFLPEKNLLCYKCLSIRQKLVLRLNMGWHFYLYYHGFYSWRTYRQGNKKKKKSCNVDSWHDSLQITTFFGVLCIHKRNLLGYTEPLSTNLSKHPICLPWHELFKCTFLLQSQSLFCINRTVGDFCRFSKKHSVS